MISIYNSLTQQKETFQPLQPGIVKMYVCGATVYDYFHIGNARMFTTFDVIVRYLRWRGYEVTYVRNITDVDDKIIKRANENNEEVNAFTARFIQAMHEDMAALNLIKPDHEPRATEYIAHMIRLIEKLVAKGYAYVGSNGDVFYSVRKFKNYGCLAHRDIDDLESGARIEINDVKQDPLDFVLWKLAKTGEPSWPSPWGAGRPGWHIECSAMSMDILGEQFDIHGGGRDLVFPHHENELAQSEAVTQKKFVNVWMHNGYLQMDKEKMSKSLGNFLTARDLLQKYHPEVLRYFLIFGHYRSPLQYSEQILTQAHNALERFYTALRDLPAAEPLANSEFEKQFTAAMDDDFNTPIAFAVLFELAHEIQRLRDKNSSLAAQHGALLKKLGDVLGILQNDPIKFLQSGSGRNTIDPQKVEALIAARNQARVNKNWAEADRIRAELTAMSVELEDGPGGTTWRRL